MDKFGLTRNGHPVEVVSAVEIYTSGRAVLERWGRHGNEIVISTGGEDESSELPFWLVIIGTGPVRVVREAFSIFDAQRIFDEEIKIARNP
jgi:hypothetical protein